MKKFFALSLFIFSSLLAFSQGMILNEELTWQQVKDKASQEGKPIFVDAYTVWCGPCKWMAKNVFTTDSAGQFYNKNFISYKLDMEKGEGIDFAKKYQVAFFPTYLYFDKKGELVHRSGGRKPLADFIEDGKKALDPEKQLITLEKKYEQGETSKSFLRNYALAMIDAGYENSDVADKYFAQMAQDEKLSAEAFSIYYAHSEINTPSFNFMKENAKKFNGVKEEEVHSVIKEKYYKKAREFGKAKNLNGLSAIEESITKDLGKRGVKELRLAYYRAAKDNAGKVRAAEDLFNEPGYAEAGMLNGVAWDIYETPASTPEDLAKALQWSERSIKLETNWAYYDTYASLCYRLKKFDEARKFAKEAILLAEKEGEDAKETKALLKRIDAEEKK